MGAIDQLKSASVVSQSLCRQALAEARADPARMPALQQAFDTKQETHFEKPEQYDLLLQFIQDWQCDKFELRPNTDNRIPQRPSVTEARITKVQDVTRDVVTNPPAPPVNPGRYRDPLHITGAAEPGAKVNIYNASQPGRPVIASTTADATGKFRIELTDETKFVFGDQMGVVAVDSGGRSSRPLIVPTEPFMVTNTTTNFRPYNGGPVSRTDLTSSMQALAPTTDNRDPFYQDGKIKKLAAEPKAAGEAWTLQLNGADDAVEPNSTITVRVGPEVFTTKAADDGTFALKVAGFLPGQQLKLEIRDVNGKGVDQPLQAPHVAFEQARIAGGVTVAPTLTLPTGQRETVGPNGGADGPWIAMKASEVTTPFGAVVVKNTTTGDVYELTADDKGSIHAAIGGISDFDVLQVATRDANGNFSPDTASMVVVPDKVAYGQLLVPVEQLKTNLGHQLKKVLENVEGPPHDLFVKKGGVDVKDARGPFLGMPAVKGLPPFGQIAVVRDGEVTQTLRADKDGVVKGYLRGVNIGDRLDLRVLDAAGRRFGEGVVGYEVPGAKTKTKLAAENIHTPSEMRAMKDCIELVGSGTLDVEHAWVQPFTIGAQNNPPTTTSFKLHYAPLVFANGVGKPAVASDAPPQQLIEQLPVGLAAKYADATTSAQALTSININVSESNGSQVLNVSNVNGRVMTLGVDYVVGTVNAGSFSQPLTAAHLPQMSQALKSCLALAAAAYDQGKEPGDLVYDRAISSAKTILYALDRFAIDNPTLRVDARAAAASVFPADFDVELFAKNVVPPEAQKTPLAAVTGKRSSTMSLIEARQAALGRLEQKLPPPTAGMMNAPHIEQAAILRRSQQLHASPVVVRGRGTPGDVVQVYNVSVGAKHLLGEALVQPDGRFELVATGQGAAGDQLGVVATTRDGSQRSRMAIVPTDAYSWDGISMSSAAPVNSQSDERAPMIAPAQLTLKNASWDAKGEPRVGGPLWTLTAAELGVEPNANVSINGKRPDGSSVSVRVRADNEGRFALEFPMAARTSFEVVVDDASGHQTKLALATPGLAETAALTGDRAVEAASGQVTMRVGKDTIKGVVIANSLTPNQDLKIKDQDRNDGFVDVLVSQEFQVMQTNGVSNSSVQYRIKISAAEAAKFTAGVNDTVVLEGAAIEQPNFNNPNMISARIEGSARILDRDYPLPRLN